MKKRKFHRGSKRTHGAMGVRELESAILKAVKVAPGCEDFAGVVVQPKTSTSRSEPNWEVRGVKFGKTDRTIASDALATVITRLQREFALASSEGQTVVVPKTDDPGS